MPPWTGVVLALGDPGAGDGLRSRLSPYLHPLAGRPLAWHAVRRLAAAGAAPARVMVVGADLSPGLFAGVPAEVQVVPPDERALGAALTAAASAGDVIVLEGAAPVGDLGGLSTHAGPALLRAADGAILAARLDSAGVERLVSRGGSLESLRAPDLSLPVLRDGEGFVVRTRADLARAGARVRDEAVRRLMDGGASFLLPETVLVDVDVEVGRDAVIYPGCVLEQGTVVGDETVVGPCCRLVAARIGRGAELKGFNYVSHIAIRNRAILEPYVRRGFDAD